jgi:hypothetical protein
LTKRTRGSTQSQTGESTYDPNCPETIPWVIPDKTRTFVDGLYEYIFSEDVHRRRYANCHHIKVIGNLIYDPIEYADPGAMCADAVTPVIHWMTNRSVYLNDTWAPQTPITSIDWKAMNAEAYLTMKPSLSSGFSLTNFIIELAEFKILFKFWARHKTFVKNVASGYLNYQFGWKLFVKDLMEIYEKLLKFNELLADYKSRQGRVLVRHYKQVLCKDTISTEYADNGVNYWENKHKRTDVFYATMKYSYVVPKINSVYAEQKALLDVLGLRLNASVLWEAIPFSFVADWFFNIGDLLQASQKDLLESVVTIHDYCCTLHSKGQSQHRVLLYNDTDCQLGTEDWEHYDRRRMIPNANDFGLKTSGRYGSKQILLSAALLLS